LRVFTKARAFIVPVSGRQDRERDRKESNLFLVFFLVLVDLEVFELVRGLVVGDDSEPVSEVVSLQVLLRQVFEVSLGEVDVRSNVDLGLVGGDRDVLAEVSDLSVDLDLLLEELLELGDGHDVVLNWVVAVDVEGSDSLLGLLALSCCLWSHVLADVQVC